MPKTRSAQSGENLALIESFLEMMSAERGAAENTLSAYRRDIADFAGACAKRGHGLKTATNAMLRDYLASLSAAALKPSSQARKLSALRRFYAFLYAEGIRRDDPCGAVASPRLNRPLPKILSQSEALSLLDAARAHSDETAQGARLLCIVEMLYASGLRVSELVALPLAAVSSNERFIHVCGKGGRERLVPLGKPAREALDAYRAAREAFLPPGTSAAAARYLFPSPRRQRRI